MGKSIFSEISAQINLGESPYIAIPSGKSSLAIEEIYAWLTSTERFKVPLQDIKSLNGVMALSSMNLKGPLLQPEKWDYRIEGKIEKLTMEASVMPGPLAITAAKFEANPEKFFCKDSQVNLLDAALEVSAAGNGWQQGFRNFEGTFQGDLGIKVMEWASTRFPLPAGITAPGSFFHFPGPPRAGTGKKAFPSTGIANGRRDRAHPSTFFIPLKHSSVNRLLIADDHSRADIRVKIQQRELRP